MNVHIYILLVLCLLFLISISIYWDLNSSIMNKIDIVILVLLIITIAIIFLGYSKYDVVYIKSDVDGQLYLVRDLPDKQFSANALAKIKQNMFTLNNYLVTNISEFKEFSSYIEQLNSKIHNSILMENGEDDVYTSYSVNKGEQIVFCLRSKTNVNHIHDINLMMYVVLHEMAHVACPSIGHTDEFKKIFAFFVEQAIKIGIYNKIDFKNNNTEYCGMMITESII